MKVWAGLGKNGSSRRKRKTNITTISICIHISSLNLVCIHIYGILLMSFTFFRFSLHRQNGPLWLYFSSLFTYLSFFFPPFFNFWLGFHDVLLTFLNNISFFPSTAVTATVWRKNCMKKMSRNRNANTVVVFLSSRWWRYESAHSLWDTPNTIN